MKLKSLEDDIDELDEELETRHGTTCIGIISKKKGKKPKSLVEF